MLCSWAIPVIAFCGSYFLIFRYIFSLSQDEDVQSNAIDWSELMMAIQKKTGKRTIKSDISGSKCFFLISKNKGLRIKLTDNTLTHDTNLECFPFVKIFKAAYMTRCYVVSVEVKFSDKIKQFFDNLPSLRPLPPLKFNANLFWVVPIFTA